MPSEFNIDDLFRKKEESYQPELSQESAHWQQMGELLKKTPLPTAKKWQVTKTRRITKWLGGFSVVTLITVVLITTINSRNSSALNTASVRKEAASVSAKKNPSVKPTASTPTNAPTANPGSVTKPSTVLPGKKSPVLSRNNAGHNKGKQALTVQAVDEKKSVAAHSSARGRYKTATNTSRVSLAKVRKSSRNNSFEIASTRDRRSDETTQAALVKGQQFGKKQLLANNYHSLDENPKPDQKNNTAFLKAPLTKGNDAATILKSFYEAMDKKEEVFEIAGNRDTILVCKQGTKLTISANSFSTSKGELINGKIKIVMREYYDYDDMIKAKLTTTSNGRQLVSGGMFNIGAKSENQEAFVTKGSSVKVFMPTNTFDENMQLFTGEATSLRPETFISSEVPREATGSNGNERYDSLSFTPLNENSYRGRLIQSDMVNWQPVGQQQVFQRPPRRPFKVFDAAGEPYKTNYGKKITAYYLIAHNNKMPDKVIKEKLTQRYGLLYDQIRVRRLWSDKRIPILTKKDRPVVGDSVEMNFKAALRLKLVSEKDSATYMSQLRSDSMYVENQKKLATGYNFNIVQMGWHNCDKFFSDPAPRVNFTLNLGEGYEAGNFVSQVIFPKYRQMVLQASYSGNQIQFEKVPEGEKVHLISIGVKEGKVIACVQAFRTSKEIQGDLVFEETTPEEFARKLKRINTTVE